VDVSEPQVFSHPDMGDHLCLFEMTDLWMIDFKTPGTRTAGGKAAHEPSIVDLVLPRRDKPVRRSTGTSINVEPFLIEEMRASYHINILTIHRLQSQQRPVQADHPSTVYPFMTGRLSPVRILNPIRVPIRISQRRFTLPANALVDNVKPLPIYNHYRF
jgi:hypothetical protein